MAGPAPTYKFPSRSGEGPEIGLVVPRYHEAVTSRLRDGALEAYRSRYGHVGMVKVVSVAGAFEVAHACSLLAARSRIAGVVALGCIVKGETSHDQVLAQAVTAALANLSLDVPVGLGVLTVDTLDQALERAGGTHGNKGADAMNAVLALIDAAAELDATLGPIGLDAGDGMGDDGYDDEDDDGGGPPSARSKFKPRRKESR